MKERVCSLCIPKHTVSNSFSRCAFFNAPLELWHFFKIASCANCWTCRSVSLTRSNWWLMQIAISLCTLFCIYSSVKTTGKMHSLPLFTVSSGCPLRWQERRSLQDHSSEAERTFDETETFRNDTRENSKSVLWRRPETQLTRRIWRRTINRFLRGCCFPSQLCATVRSLSLLTWSPNQTLPKDTWPTHRGRE